MLKEDSELLLDEIFELKRILDMRIEVLTDTYEDDDNIHNSFTEE
jgi:hypothetical protein